MASDPQNPAFDAWMLAEGGALLDRALGGLYLNPTLFALLRKTLVSLLRATWVESEIVKLKG